MKRSSGRPKLGRLVASLYLDEPAFAPEVLDPLQDFSRRWLSVWQEGLRVARNEDDDEPGYSLPGRRTPRRSGRPGLRRSGWAWGALFFLGLTRG